jgi:3-methyl-2-oxobutanoate hydroxymethyltransferase
MGDKSAATGYLATSSTEAKPLSLLDLKAMRARGEPIAMLTCYDASFAQLLDRCGVDMLLVGDSLGNVVQGHSSTARVTLEEMLYHTEAVARGTRRGIVVMDLPWNSYQRSVEQACDSAGRAIAAGAKMVKLEGGAWLASTVRFLTERGIPVCAHLGLMPQTAAASGGFKVQGREASAADEIVRTAATLVEAGAASVLLEMVPSSLGKRVTETITAPTIGIGAGPDTSGQVLVLYDVLDVFPGRKARFVKNYMAGAGMIEQAVRNYVAEVKARTYPAPEII